MKIAKGRVRSMQTELPVERHYRFCPSCGNANLDPGSVPFKCESCGFAQFFGPVAAVGGLIENADGSQLLLVKRAREPGLGKWGLPGGFVDRGESVEAALSREILEETQLVVCDIRYLTSGPNRYAYHGIVSPVIDLFYTCRVERQQDLQLAQEELSHFQWVRPDAALLADMAFESNRRAVEFWLLSNRVDGVVGTDVQRATGHQG